MIAVQEMPTHTLLRGSLLEADKVSARGPMGAGGHRVIFPKATLVQAAPTLQGKNVLYNSRRIGVIQSGILDDITGKLIVSAILDIVNCADDIAVITAQQSLLACAYEVADVQIADEKAEVWEITHCVFTGVSLKPALELA